MKYPEWSFRRMSLAENEVDPAYEEYFEDQRLPVTTVLMREAIQNSLDAVNRDNPIPTVEVRVSWTQLDRTGKIRYLSGLIEPLKLTGNNYSLLNESGPIPCLIIEDFGTRGLIGNPLRRDSVDDRNDFYYFFRKVGASQKSARDRGSRGLGKVVFPKASGIRSFIALTNRISDGRKFLMGQALLKVFDKGRDRFEPYGYLCERGEEQVPIPIEDAQIHNDFSHDFGVTRDNEPGLSIIIPFVDDAISPKEAIYSVLSECYYSLLKGDLQISFSNNGVTTAVSSDNITLVAENYPDVMKKVSFAKLALETPLNQKLILLKPELDRPKLDKSLFPDGSIQNIVDAYGRYARLSIRLPIDINSFENGIQNSFFDVYLQKEQGLADSEEYYIRMGTNLIDERNLRIPGHRALMVIEEGPLATLLREAENPAHTKWNQNSPRLRAKYDNPAAIMKFVRGTFGELIRLLGEESDEVDTTSLSKFFPDEEGGLNGHPPPPPPPPPSKPTICTLGQISGGFTASHNSKLVNLPKKIHFELAYDIRRGNPFKKYDVRDFSLTDPSVKIDVTFARYDILSDNEIELRPESEDYRLAVTGFDIGRRDLKVRVEEVSD